MLSLSRESEIIFHLDIELNSDFWILGWSGELIVNGDSNYY